MEGGDPIFFGVELRCFLLFSLYSLRVKLSIELAIRYWHTNIILLVLVFLELFFDQEEPLDGHLNLRLMLSTTPSQLFEVIGRIREVFQPNSEFMDIFRRVLFILDGFFLSLLSGRIQPSFKSFGLFGFESTKGHRDAGQDLVSRPR